MRTSLSLIGLFVMVNCAFSACNEPTIADNNISSITKDLNLKTPRDFYYSLAPALKNCTDSISKNKLADSIYLLAKSKNWLPIVFADTAIFVYKHSSSTTATVQVFGDLNGWSADKSPQLTLKNHPQTRLYTAIYKAPSTKTRVDYKLVVNGNWMLDPGNPKVAWGGMGSNSELALSEYVYSDWVKARNSGLKGWLSDNKKIQSDTLNYAIDYKVYLPTGYTNTQKYPVLFVTDGQEYSDKNLGALNIIADNLIMDGLIKPIIIVFVDPRDPATGTNRRMTELVNNVKYTHFLSVELYNQIFSQYSIVGTADQTAILGTSLGGINSAYTGILCADVFGLIAIQSPAFWYYPNILNLYQSTSKKNLKIYMDTGTIYDTQDKALEMKRIMESKAYNLKYSEFSEGHSWGNWRAHLNEVLLYFFQK